MTSGKICPVCDRDIGVWCVLLAPLPSRVTCPHCRSRLRYADTGVLVATLIALLLACAAGAFFFVLRFYPLTRLEMPLAAGALMLALWLPLEFFVALYLRATKSLRPASQDRSP